jgi:hypothetical protein
MNIIGIDFSIIKPAACIFSNNQHYFVSWPYGLSEKLSEIYKNSGVKISKRLDIRDNKISDISLKSRLEIKNANSLANQMIEDLYYYLNRDTIVALEGLSYGSTGNQTLSLSGWRFILLYKLSQIVPLDNIYTYSPITVKSTAGCAKKGMSKPDMIRAFISYGPDCLLKNNLNKNQELFMKKGAKNFIEHLDDLVDAYWVLETSRSRL